MEEVIEEANSVVDILALEGLSRVALPLIDYLGYHEVFMAKTCLSTSHHNVGRRESTLCLQKTSTPTHPPACLVLVVTSEHERQGQQSPLPKAKDAKKLDLFHRKVYSIGGAPTSYCEPASHPQHVHL